MSDSDRKALTAQIASEEARLSELEAEQAAARQRLDALRAQLKPLI
jgi:cell division protein FtsB